MIQIKESTFEEQRKIYMACKKEELVEMLIQANKHIFEMTQQKHIYNSNGQSLETIILTQK